MLFLLSSPQQGGKTRWLQSVVGELERDGLPCRGVLAPGRWRRTPGGLAKTGIDNLLLPEHELVPFAVAACDGPAGAGCAQSRAAGLGWDISEEALARVNAHLAQLDGCGADAVPGLLVIDELGPLELLRGGGLTSALSLLGRGPQPAWPHALVVVRSSLLAVAEEELRPAWGEPEPLGPDAASRSRLLGILVR